MEKWKQSYFNKQGGEIPIYKCKNRNVIEGVLDLRFNRFFFINNKKSSDVVLIYRRNDAFYENIEKETEQKKLTKNKWASFSSPFVNNQIDNFIWERVHVNWCVCICIGVCVNVRMRFCLILNQRTGTVCIAPIPILSISRYRYLLRYCRYR